MAEGIKYKIVGEKNKPIHTIPYQHSKEEIKNIVERHIVFIDPGLKEVGTKSLLERFFF